MPPVWVPEFFGDVALVNGMVWPFLQVEPRKSRLRILNGYPLENSWGKAIYPKTDGETVERVKLLTQENAQLRAELGAIKDRLATVERIVTDESHALVREIEDLRSRPAN